MQPACVPPFLFTPPLVPSVRDPPPTPCVVVLARVCECETHRVFVDVELCFRGTFVLSCLRLCLCSTSDKPGNYLHRGAPEGRHRAGGGQRGGQPRHAVSEGQGS